MRVFTIVGISGSGKTTVAEEVIRRLRARGLSVASAKSIACGRPGVERCLAGGGSPHSREPFTIDTPGSNSYRHRQAGSQLVVTRAEQETAVLFQEELPFPRLLPFFEGYDFVVLEGDYDCPAPRIVTGWEPADVEERLNDLAFAVSGRAAAGRDRLGGLPAFDPADGEAMDALTRLILERVYEKLPDLDPDCCSLCGLGCRRLGAAILRGEARREDCRLSSPAVTLEVDGRKLPMAPFVQRILRNSALAVVRELDGYREGARVVIRVGGEGKP